MWSSIRASWLTLSAIFISAATRAYLILLLNLPICYAARTRRYTTTVQRIAFISLLIDEWKTFTVASGFWLSLSPFAPISVSSMADRHCSVVFVILEFQDAASDHIVMQILGCVCMACAVMTFTFSLLLIVTFRAHRVDLESQDRATNISLLFRDPILIVWWNIYILVALPAVWMA